MRCSMAIFKRRSMALVFKIHGNVSSATAHLVNILSDYEVDWLAIPTCGLELLNASRGRIKPP